MEEKKILNFEIFENIFRHFRARRHELFESDLELEQVYYIYLSMYVCIYVSIPEFRDPLYRPCQEVTVYLETYIYASTRNQLL